MLATREREWLLIEQQYSNLLFRAAHRARKRWYRTRQFFEGRLLAWEPPSQAQGPWESEDPETINMDHIGVGVDVSGD